jgi:hypothetical protein
MEANPGMSETSEIAIREKMNGKEQNCTKLNNIGIGFENTIDYGS